MTFGNFAFYKVVFYSLLHHHYLHGADPAVHVHGGVVHLARVGSMVSKIVYYLCVFSMVVPFQMVMYHPVPGAGGPWCDLNTPWTIPVVYLGFGAGLAVFMFTGFVKSHPAGDRGGRRHRRLRPGAAPSSGWCCLCCKPTVISVGVLEIMWVWNDYLLPYLVLDMQPVHAPSPSCIQYLKGSYGTVDMGATMALHHAEHPAGHHLLSVLPEAHHQGRGRRRREGLRSIEPPLGGRG